MVQPHQRVTDLAERMLRTLGVARALAQNGRRLDLTGFDDGIGRLCAQTLDLPSQEGRALVPLLTDVLGQVELLCCVLRTGNGPQLRQDGHVC
jgi:hypothetical protein